MEGNNIGNTDTTHRFREEDAKYVIEKVGGVLTKENISWLAEYLEGIYSLAVPY